MNKSDRAELKRLIVQIERDFAQVHLRTPWTASGTTIATQQEETTINELMVRQMKLRRRALPEQPKHRRPTLQSRTSGVAFPHSAASGAIIRLRRIACARWSIEACANPAHQTPLGGEAAGDEIGEGLLCPLPIVFIHLQRRLGVLDVQSTSVVTTVSKLPSGNGTAHQSLIRGLTGIEAAPSLGWTSFSTPGLGSSPTTLVCRPPTEGRRETACAQSVPN